MVRKVKIYIFVFWQNLATPLFTISFLLVQTMLHFNRVRSGLFLKSDNVGPPWATHQATPWAITQSTLWATPRTPWLPPWLPSKLAPQLASGPSHHAVPRATPRATPKGYLGYWKKLINQIHEIHLRPKMSILNQIAGTVGGGSI